MRKPLKPPYSGPHRVIRRINKKTFIDVNGTSRTASVDILKPAFLETTNDAPTEQTDPRQQQPSTTDAQTTKKKKTVSFLPPTPKDTEGDVAVAPHAVLHNKNTDSRARRKQITSTPFILMTGRSRH